MAIINALPHPHHHRPVRTAPHCEQSEQGKTSVKALDIELKTLKSGVKRLLEATVGERANLANVRGLCAAWRAQAVVAEHAASATRVFDTAVEEVEAKRKDTRVGADLGFLLIKKGASRAETRTVHAPSAIYRPSPERIWLLRYTCPLLSMHARLLLCACLQYTDWSMRCMRCRSEAGRRGGEVGRERRCA